MNKKNKKKARTEPVKYRFLTQKEDLMTPELIKEMRNILMAVNTIKRLKM